MTPEQQKLVDSKLYTRTERPTPPASARSAGSVVVHAHVKLDMDELVQLLRPDQIKALFDGIAKVLAPQNDGGQR